MRTCKTCKHWGKPKEKKNFVEDTEARICDAIKMGGKDYGDDPDYKETLLIDETGEEVQPDQAVAMDGSGYFAALITGPEFGCNKHEEEGQ